LAQEQKAKYASGDKQQPFFPGVVIHCILLAASAFKFVGFIKVGLSMSRKGMMGGATRFSILAFGKHIPLDCLKKNRLRSCLS
jgi:hypothetical protein